MGALLARFVASLLRIPEILVLVAFGALFGSSVLDVVDVPFESLWRAADLHARRVDDPVLWRVDAVAADPAAGVDVLGAAGRARRRPHRSRCGHHRAFRLRPAVGSRLPRGRGSRSNGPCDPDPALRAVRASNRRWRRRSSPSRRSTTQPGAALALYAGGSRADRQTTRSAGPAGEFLVDLGISTVIGIVAGVVLVGGDLERPLRDLARESRRSRCSPWSRSASSRSTQRAGAAISARSSPA